MRISVQSNTAAIRAWLQGVQARQIPYATKLALDKTATQVRQTLREEMVRAFNKPTNFTLNSLYIEYAKKDNLTARVWLKDLGFRQHYLIPQIEGGARPLKRFEKRLVQIGAMMPGERAVPGQGATIDAFGNMSRGQIVQILSQLGSAGFSGDYSVATNSRRSRAKRAKVAYFVASRTRERTRHLHPGIYSRRSFGAWGTAIKPVIMFVNGATYRKRFDFYGIGNRVVKSNWAENYRQALAQAMSTAR